MYKIRSGHLCARTCVHLCFGCPGPQPTEYQQQQASQMQQLESRGAPASSMAAIDWSGSGMVRPSTFNQQPRQQQPQQPPPPPQQQQLQQPTPPNLPQKPSQRGFSNLQLDSIAKAPGAVSGQRGPAPMEWRTHGTPGVADFVALDHMYASQRPSASPYTHVGYAPESPPASRGQSPDPLEASTTVEVYRPSAGSSYAYTGPGHDFPGALMPEGGPGRAQSLVAADWSSRGIPRSSSYAPVSAPRLSSIPESNLQQPAPGTRSPSPQGFAVGGRSQPPMSGSMMYVGDLAAAGGGGMSRGAAQSMPPSQWERVSVGPSGSPGVPGGVATARGGAAASMFVGSPQHAGMLRS